MTFVIIHGAFGNPGENWFPWLKNQLEKLGSKIIIPKFPTPENQTLDNWLKTFEGIKTDINQPICIIGHSLGPVFILHAVDKFNIQLNSAIFVSPFAEKLDNPEFDKVNSSFYKTSFDYGKLKKLIPKSYVFYSDNDPYVSTRHSIDFADSLESQKIQIKGAGHFGEREFPEILQLCKELIQSS